MPPDFKLIENAGLPFWRSQKLAAAHGFFGRRGGVSTGLYASLNCGPGSGDDAAAVAENRARVAAALGGGDILSLYQVHGAGCLSVDAPFDQNAERPKVDALVTDQPGLLLSILTADCAPVLFYGESAAGKPVIGAAHAGWRGVLGGVLESTLHAMAHKGAVAERITAAIGPCIAKRSYEVSLAFYQEFLQKDEAAEGFFGAAAKDRHFLFDLPGYCALRLSRAGVRQIALADLDTYAASDDFFSFRRTTHKAETDYGRQIAVICIRP